MILLHSDAVIDYRSSLAEYLIHIGLEVAPDGQAQNLGQTGRKGHQPRAMLEDLVHNLCEVVQGRLDLGAGEDAVAKHDATEY